MSGLLERNLALLSNRDPALADRIRRCAFTVRVDPTPSGAVTARIEGEDGAQVLLHHPDDPWADARAAVRPANPDAVLLIGMGLGYSAVEAARRVSARCWIAVVEPAEDLFRAALEHVDLTELLSRERTRLFVGLGIDALRTEFRRWLADSQADEVYLLSHSPLERARPSLYGPVLREVEALLNRRRTEIATLVENAERLARNWIGNMPSTARSAGLHSFENRLSGIPAIVVAAGPSLDSHLDALGRAAGRAVFVCVGKSLRLLLSRGIVPEFACHLDLSPDSAACFEGFEIPRDVTLVWDPESHPAAVRACPGDRVTFETGLAGSQLGRPFWGGKGTLARGLSVAHTAFAFARALGADPIVLVGTDLALPGNRTHAEGVTMTWGGPVEPLLGAAVDVPSTAGGVVRTIPAFRAMVTLFEEEIARTKAVVVNASAIGALIRGARRGDVESALGGAVDARGPLRTALAEPRPFDRETFRSAARRWMESIGTIERAAEEGERTLRRAARLDPANRLDREEFGKAAEKVNGRRARILAETDLQPLLHRILAPEAVEIQRTTREMEAASAAERARLDVARTGVFFRGYRRAAAVFRDAFVPVRDELLG
ncbi:MAG: DUF115 domain-containing protein [Planctomycetes bacterium]|nr:DUF115 domain-containing protein [Planctomycetota bacterium]